MQAMKMVAFFSALMAIALTAQAGDYNIMVDRKRDPQSVEKGDIEKNSSQTWKGEVKVDYLPFKTSPNLQGRYIIFVKRQKLGDTGNADVVEQVKGSFDIPPIKGGGSAKFLTNEVVLNKTHLAPGWRMGNGGRGIAEDSILGVWVRLYQGDNQVAEYINTTTLVNKYKWEP